MSHDPHNNNGHQENKPVSFTTPLILGAVTVFIILCFVSLGNPCHGHGKEECCEGQKCSKECMEACEKGDHSKHPGATGHEEGHAGAMHEEHAAEHANTTDTTSPTSDTQDSTHTEPVKEEAHH